MGFCRRCGEIVVGPRCKCGGTSVAPVVPWNQLNPKQQTQDRWSKTYVARDKSPARSPSRGPSVEALVASHNTGTQHGSPTKRFPRPISSSATNSTPMSSRVTAHIASTTSHLDRPPSPLKHSTTALSDPVPESGILPSPHASSLAKVYGSVLQPKETLTMHSCAICASPFLPDATIYPDPNDISGNTRFLCRPCFTTNGGSKGICPTCSRPVLTLKSEGTFVAAADKVWHKKCFRCDGCFKPIGDTPMVDLLGKPSCVECFDGCLKRDGNTPKKKWDSPHGEKTANSNLGGLKAGKSREGSPAIEELEQRLGIVKSRESSPTLEELSHRLSMVGKNSERRYSAASRDGSPGTPLSRSLKGKADLRQDGSPSPSPVRSYQRSDPPEGGISPIRYTTTSSSSPKPTGDAIEAMKKRFFNGNSGSPGSSPNVSPQVSSHSPRTSQIHGSSPATKNPTPSKIPVAVSASRQGLTSPKSLGYTVSGDRKPNRVQERDEFLPPVPDLISDFSDTTTQSSGPNSPPRDDMDADVFDDEGTIRGRERGRSIGAGNYPYDAYRRGDFLCGEDGVITPTRSPRSKFTSTPVSKTKSSTTVTNVSAANRPEPCLSIPPSLPPDATCARCHGALFDLRANTAGGRFVTVQEETRESGQQPKTYHTECFRCVVCDEQFKEDGTGKAVFVRGERGACHVDCARPKKISVKSIPSPTVVRSTPVHSSPTYTSTHSTSSRYDRSPLTAPPTSTPSLFPRFGGGTSCPGCHKSVSPMERGVVPGPQGTRWHAGCLVCGGKKEMAKGMLWRKEERKRGDPGCGKKLDSAAKGDGEGGIWCRECLLLLPAGMRGSPQGSPTRSALAPAYTGSGSTRIAPQFTGMTTLARQFTGVGSTDAALMRQLTGGGLSPTRQLDRWSPTKGLLDRPGSPVKQLATIRERPRPKSVIGMRSTKSIDEGRGMFLVRQMTGSTSVGGRE